MAEADPDLPTHLGDVYLVGDEDEIQENSFGIPTQNYAGVVRPKGRLGGFASTATTKHMRMGKHNSLHSSGMRSQ
jgi:hypothetical protein